MTKLLASVTGVAEARLALTGGADLIDLKDPARGALGAVSAAVLRDVLADVAGRRPVSAVAGDLPMEAEAVAAAVAERFAADYVKIGLFPAPRESREAVIRALGSFSGRTGLVAVLFADADPDFTLLPLLEAAGFRGAMVDTAGKAGGRLLDHLPPLALAGFVASCRDAGLMSGLAGSLEPPDIPRLLALEPDYLGFRGALTRGGRDGPLDPEALAAIRRLVDGGASPSPDAGGTGTTRVFVRDFVQEMEVGAYGFERGRRQRVRFSLEAEIRRPAARPEAMADVYSYDLMMDAVRAIAAKGHADLVETLAEDLAATILRDRRVEAVTLRVEKLDLGPAAAGVEIRRTRNSSAKTTGS